MFSPTGRCSRRVPDSRYPRRGFAALGLRHRDSGGPGNGATPCHSCGHAQSRRAAATRPRDCGPPRSASDSQVPSGATLHLCLTAPASAAWEEFADNLDSSGVPAARPISNSAAVDALIVRRRRTTLGVGMTRTFAAADPGKLDPRAWVPLMPVTPSSSGKPSLTVGLRLNSLPERKRFHVNHVWYRLSAKLSTWFRRFAPPALAALVAAWASLGATGAPDSDSLPLHALAASSSLYLREAASGPVRWQSWNQSTLSLARRLDRPLLIDVGAVWCHWCHVMDQTTYADPEVANLINQHFIPIKVDSDQQPDIDSYYQAAAARLSGAGGWPLTCFAMPDGGLFLAFGYLPAGSGGGAQASGALGMVKVLQRVSQVFTTQKEALAKESARNLAELKEQAMAPAQHGSSADLLKEILAAIRAAYDKNSGGFGGGNGPRFYDFPALELGLSYGYSGHPDYTAIAIESLRKIADGGVYDQLGGGFHRYSTDPRWRLPHFEKLLYDQAMGLESYCQGYEATGDENLARVARGITNYVAGTLLDPKNHVFYAHQDADSFAGDDGSYYTWTRDEIARALPAEEAAAAMEYFGIENDPTRAPDSRFVLRRALDAKQLASRLQLSEAQARGLLSKARSGLLAARGRRRKPAVDEAILVDRNALAAKAYLIAAAALHDSKQRKIALDDLDYLRVHARAPDGSYFHLAASSRRESVGLLNDQVYMLDALLAAYQSSGKQLYLSDSKALADLIIRNYFDPESGLLHDRA